MLLDQNVLLDRLMHGQDLIGKSRAEFFLPEKNFEEETILSALELGSEGVWHRIVDIEQDLCSHQFWEQRAEYEEVWHVVHVDGGVALAELQTKPF